MQIKLSNKFLSFLSFLLALIGLTFFFFYKLPFLSSSFSLDVNKSLILLSITTLSLFFYIIDSLINKNILVPEHRSIKFLFLLFPILIIISTLFSNNILTSFFGKYVYLQSGISYISIIILTFILSSRIKVYKRLGWLFLFLSSIFITIPTIFGLIFLKFGLTNLSNKIVYFVDSWDTVALVSGIIVIMSLIYFETIAFSKTQKIFSGIFVFLHILVLAFIAIPDIWYTLFFSILFIFLISKNYKKIFKKLSFYILIVASLFSVMYLFSYGGFATNVSNKLSSFTNKYIGINYNFVKPKALLSFELAKSEILKGRLFGSGPADYYKVWQKEKTKDVINSNYWDTDFISSYSSFTTLLVTLGVLGVLSFLFVYLSTGLYLIKKNVKEYRENYNSLDSENKFYLFVSTALVIYSFFIFLFFVNIPNALVLFSISIAFSLSNKIKWKESNKKSLNILFILLFIILVLGLTISIKRIKSTNIINNAILEYQTDNNIETLENKLIKATKITNNDINNRLLSQFYVFKTRLLLNSNTENENTEEMQRKILESVNNAIKAANIAIEKDKNDYNNFLTLGSVYEFIMTFDKENRDSEYELAKNAYTRASELYPKNPSIYLILAQLEYDYKNNVDSTVENLNKSLEVKQNYSQAFYAFSQLAIKNNDLNSALQYSVQAIQSNPQNIDALLQYGILILEKKDLSQEDLNQAYTAFIMALNIDPNNTIAAYYLSITYTLAGEYQKARNIINVLKQVLPDNQKVLELEELLNNSEKSNTNKTDNKEKESKIEDKTNSSTTKDKIKTN